MVSISVAAALVAGFASLPLENGGCTIVARSGGSCAQHFNSENEHAAHNPFYLKRN